MVGHRLRRETWRDIVRQELQQKKFRIAAIADSNISIAYPFFTAWVAGSYPFKAETTAVP
jgi:hypothetical protein